MQDDREFKFLLDKIRRNRGIDFSQYRPQVLKRRILHRLHVTGCEAYCDYIVLLNKDSEEYEMLVVIMLKNYSYPQYRKKCMKAGVDSLFDKSTELDQIPLVVRELIQGSHV